MIELFSSLKIFTARRFGINEVVFVAFDERFDVLRGNQLDSVVQRADLSSQPMGAAARLHHHRAGR